MATELTEEERKWLALALQGFAFRHGGDNSHELDPAVMRITVSIMHKLGIEKELRWAAEDWIEYATKRFSAK